jgi:phage shock protein E
MFDFFSSLFGGGADLSEVITKDAFLVDVRTSGEYASGHIKGSVNIPLDRVESNIQKFKGKDNIVVFCRSGNRSGQARSILEAHGIKGVTNGGSIDNVRQYVK